MSRVGVVRDWGVTQLGQWTQIGQRNIIYFMTPCLAIKTEVEEEEEWERVGMGFKVVANQTVAELWSACGRW